jgi:hypothetical protein
MLISVYMYKVTENSYSLYVETLRKCPFFDRCQYSFDFWTSFVAEWKGPKTFILNLKTERIVKLKHWTH